MLRFLLILFSVVPNLFAGEPANEHEKQSLERHVYEGQVAMGPNHFMGGPIADLGDLGTVNLYAVGLYNPNGPDPIVLTEDMNIPYPYSAVLATIVDPAWEALGAPTDFGPEFVNIPLHAVPTKIENGTVSLGGSNSTDQIGIHQAEPFGPITLGKWMEAMGTCVFECLADGGSMMTIDVGGMLGNRTYTVWGIFGGGPLAVIPLGGIPNTVVTDEVGVGRIKRRLNFCPLDYQDDDRPLLWISLAYHSDHASYGNVPAPDMWPEGVIHHTQLQFFIDATVIEKRKIQPTSTPILSHR